MSRLVAVRLAALLFSVFLMCGIEWGCRLFLSARGEVRPLEAIRELLERDSELFWKQRPNRHSLFFGAAVDTDEYGLRNPPGAVERRADREFRVVVLGASPSLGWGVPDGSTYARLLERRLQAASPDPIKVVNASVIGYSSWQGLRLLRQRIAVLRPDHLVVAFGINDVTRERFFYSGPVEDKALQVRSVEAVNFVFQLATTQVLAGLLDRFRARQASSAAFPVRVALEDFKANHRELVALAKAHGATVSFLIIPFRFPERPLDADPKFLEMRAAESRSKLYFDALRSLARDDGVPSCDTTEPLYGQYEKYFLVDKADYIHPNAAGHAVIGEALASQLTGLLSARRSTRPAAATAPAAP
jgi:lysophospholipase L1-like esterase